MKELLLLAVEKVGKTEFFLHSLELKHHKMIKIFKNSCSEDFKTQWKIGHITVTENISRYELDDNAYTSKNDKLMGKYPRLEVLLLNKTSYPDAITKVTSDSGEGIIRLREIKIIEKGKKIEFMPWGTEEKWTLNVEDPFWVKYWSKMFSLEKKDYYEKYLSSPRRKVIGLIEKKDAGVNIKKIIVL